jgi:DNA-binding HxlR family transcriptional regulator
MKQIIEKLNKTFDSRIRLGIMSLLVVHERLEFTLLKELLSLSDGNLASHLKGLEIETYVEFHKQFVGRKPKTTYVATELGKKAFAEHLDALEALWHFGKQDDVSKS